MISKKVIEKAHRRAQKTRLATKWVPVARGLIKAGCVAHRHLQ